MNPDLSRLVKAMIQIGKMVNTDKGTNILRKAVLLVGYTALGRLLEGKSAAETKKSIAEFELREQIEIIERALRGS